MSTANEYPTTTPGDLPTPGTPNGSQTQTSSAPWPKPLQPAALYGLAGQFITALSPHTEADPAAMLVQFLARAGTTVGRGPHMRVGATRHYLNENVIVPGETNGGRKGMGGDNIEELFRHVAVRVPIAHVETQSGLSTGEGLINAVRDPLRSTKAGEKDDPGVRDKRLLVVEPEFASALRVMQREGNTLSPVLRNVWDGKNLQTMTKGSPMKSTAPHVSIVGHITPTELRRELARVDMVNGLANRFLFACSRRTHLLPDGGSFPTMKLEPVIAGVADAIEAAHGLDVELTRDADARDLWHEVYPRLTRDVPGLFGAIIARGAAHVLRLSGIYALLDGVTSIRVEHLQAALAVWQYCEDSARAVFGDAVGDLDADRLLRALKASPTGLTRDDITRGVFQKNYDSDRIERALALLAQSGLAYRHSTRTGQPGRPAERWIAVDVATQIAA